MGAPSRLYASLNLTRDVSRTTASEYLQAIAQYEGLLLKGKSTGAGILFSVPCSR